MNKISKKASIEPSRSRWPGLLPFVGETPENGNSGNYGELVCDIVFSGLAEDVKYGNLSYVFSEPISYSDLMDYYAWLNDFFDSCTYYIGIEKESFRGWSMIKSARQIDALTEITRDSELYRMAYWQRDLVNVRNTTFVDSIPEETYANTIIGVARSEEDFDKFTAIEGRLLYEFIEEAIGRVIVPDYIEGDLVPSFVYLPDIPQLIATMLTYKEGSCCDIRKYVNLGGDDMIEFLSTFDLNYILEKKAFFDSISNHECNLFIPILLTQSMDDMGLVTPIGEEWVPGKVYSTGDKVFFGGHTFECVEPTSGIDREYLFNFEAMLEYGIWSQVRNEEGDTEDIVYMGESQLSGLRVSLSYDDDNNELPGVFDPVNRTMLLPYKVNVPYNTYGVDNLSGMTDMIGDVISAITDDESGGIIEITYLMGCKLTFDDNGNYTGFVERTGDKYEDVYNYTPSAITFTYEGTEYQDVECAIIDYDSAKVDIDSRTRNVILSRITCYNGDISGQDDYIGDGETYSDVFRTEESFGISEPFRWNLQIDIDRGTSAAFERNLKLMEVNTFQDLLEYQNNYFNIETK